MSVRRRSRFPATAPRPGPVRHGAESTRGHEQAGYELTKRLLDLVVAVVLLLLSAPVMAVVAVAIAVTVGRPVLFRQVRPGRHGELFELVKFRTMHRCDLTAALVTTVTGCPGSAAGCAPPASTSCPRSGTSSAAR